METDDSGASQFTTSTAPVNLVSKGKDTSKVAFSKPCYPCSGHRHHTKCPFRDSECYGCHKKGHTKAACKESTQASNKPKSDVGR